MWAARSRRLVVTIVRYRSLMILLTKGASPKSFLGALLTQRPRRPLQTLER